MNIFALRLQIAAMAVLFLGGTSPVFAASSMSKNGVTWTFDRNYTTGVYANGDPWVVGPVTITSISPLPVEGRNGTMINPQIGNNQGFDKDLIAGYNDYVSALNVGKNLPLTVPVDSSVVSSITADGWTSWNTIQMFSILTVVQSAPAPGAFRPPAVGNGSRASQWNESQLDYTKLNTLARSAISATPALSSYVQWFSYPWLELNPNWTGGYIRPSYMAPNGYGRDLAYRTGDAALLLNLDFTNAQKRDLLVGFVQVGIDNYGFLSKGGVWYNDGGHNIGRLSPVLVAAAVLNDGNMKAILNGSLLKFHEYQSTFFVSQADINLAHGVWNHDQQKLTGTNGDPLVLYTAADLGKPEWGIRHTGNPELDNNYYAASYRDINGANHTAPTMAAKVMGMRAVMAWEPLFKYAERHLDYEQSAGYKGEFAYNPTPAFHKQFYNVYKNAGPGSGTGGNDGGIIPPTYSFAIGDRIQVSKNTNVRASGALTGTLLGVQSAASSGTIIGGPVGPDADSITWWQMNYDNGTDGWSGQDNFVKLSGQRPSKPSGFGLE